MIVSRLKKWFGFGDHPPAQGAGPAAPPAFTIPEVDLQPRFDGSFKLAMLEPAVVNGNVSLYELMVINHFILVKGARRVFEIGTFDGRTTVNMAANAPEDAVIYTLDLPPEKADAAAHALDPYDQQFIDKPQSGARFQGRNLSRKIVQLYGDSARFDYAPYQGAMDVVFVDGSHSYEYVLSDTEAALRLVKPQGLILWHDYQEFWSGVKKALEELNDRHPRCAGMKHIAHTSLVYLEVQPGPPR